MSECVPFYQTQQVKLLEDACWAAKTEYVAELNSHILTFLHPNFNVQSHILTAGGIALRIALGIALRNHCWRMCLGGRGGGEFLLGT